MTALPADSFVWTFAARACGSLGLRLGDGSARLRPSGALWLEEVRALCVADLHLEKGSAYAVRGQMLPPYDTRETLGRLAAEVEALGPDLIVLMGDSFHDRRSEDRLAPEDAERLSALARGRDLIWIVGNHDSDGPQRLPGRVVAEVSLQGLTLRHEPRAGAQPGEIAGHLHPAARVVATGGSVRRRCFITDGERAILPAFGAYAGGLNVRDQAFAGLFVRSPLVAALGRTRVHAVGWRSLAADGR